MITALGKDVFSVIEEVVEPSHTALLIIDMQHDFCSPKGLFDRIGKDLGMMRPAVKRVASLVETARNVGVTPIFIQNQWLPNNRAVSGSFLRFMIFKQGMDPKEGCTVSGSWGAGILPETGIRPDDIVVQKWRPSAFRSTNLDMVLRCNNIRSVVLTGVITQGCVESTARDAMFHDYYTVVVKDCVATYNRDLHDASLKVMGSRFDMISADELTGLWQGEAAAAAQ
ncbi:MAG: isochorismatase family cysteine hydrolase [Pseudorhodoplanes sp.]|uniref:isochorismatase family cysteine hydrolase n=1 Tax=Pseudorhodoplanes sp. TaxID=1934341 RepID=UPI003D12DAD3